MAELNKDLDEIFGSKLAEYEIGLNQARAASRIRSHSTPECSLTGSKSPDSLTTQAGPSGIEPKLTRFPSSSPQLTISRQTPSQPPKLDTLPPEVLGHLLKFFEYQKYCQLKKVSKTLRQLIEDARIAPTFESIYFKFKTGTISTRMQSFVRGKINFVDYVRHNGCTVRNGFRHRHVPENFKDVFFSDMEYLLEKSMKVKTLRFGDKSQTEEGRDWFAKLAVMLSERKRKIKVEKLYISASEQESIMGVLTCVDPLILRKLKIKGVDKHEPRAIHLDQIMTTDQWLQAKQVLVKRCILPNSWDAFLHLTNIIISHTQMSSTQLIGLKNIALTQENIEIIACENVHFEGDISFLFPAHSHVTYVVYGQEKKRYLHAIPGRFDYIVGVTHDYWLRFEKLRGSKIPENAFELAGLANLHL